MTSRELVAGRYELLEPIAEGGQGTVYRALQQPLGREVALKVMLAGAIGGADAVGRFAREASLLQRLEHPNTVRLFDFGTTDDGRPFMVYELLRGRTLEEEIASASLTPLRVGRVALQVLKALSEAHALGLVHRDIKPSNVFLVDYAGETDFVKVLDFGIARPVATEAEKGITAKGQLVGTPGYMAPEQVTGGTLGPPTDLYALGLVMAEALTGEKVFGKGNAIQIWLEQSSPDPVPLSIAVRTSVFGAVIRRATAKAIGERYPSAREMLDDVERALEQCSAPTDPLAAPIVTRAAFAPTVPLEVVVPTPAPPPPPARAPRAGLVAAIALVGVALIGGVYALRSEPPEHAVRPSPPLPTRADPPHEHGPHHLQALTREAVLERLRRMHAVIVHDYPPNENVIDVRAQLGDARFSVLLRDLATPLQAEAAEKGNHAAVELSTASAVARDGRRLLIVRVSDGDKATADKLLAALLE